MVAKLRAAQLTPLATLSLEDDPCVGFSLCADPSTPDSKRMYHFISIEGAWPKTPQPAVHTWGFQRRLAPVTGAEVARNTRPEDGCRRLSRPAASVEARESVPHSLGSRSCIWPRGLSRGVWDGMMQAR
jgi:hypothetical protein